MQLFADDGKVSAMVEFAFFSFVLLLILGAYWSLSVFPRQRDFSKRQRFVRSLAEGDEVITTGGIIGKVLEIDAQYGIAYIEIADGVIVRVIAASILQEFNPEELAQNVRKALNEEAPSSLENS